MATRQRVSEKTVNHRQLTSDMETQGLGTQKVHLLPASGNVVGSFFCLHVIDTVTVTVYKENDEAIAPMLRDLTPGFYYGPITEITITGGYAHLFGTALK